jgi:hypothetical protein
MGKEKPTTKICKHCKTEIPYGAKVCPQCRKNQDGKGCLISAIVTVVAISIFVSCSVGSIADDVYSASKNRETAKGATEEIATIPVTKSDGITQSGDPSESETNSTTTAVSSAAVQEKTTELSMGQKNALSTAAGYLNYTAFSYSGLIAQLEYEQYSTEDATFAADNCGADWNEQAAIMAQQYLDYSSFSRGSLIDQLKYEGFTQTQAEYGVSAVGY